ncbi:glutathione binding-like protein [Ancylobacter lacus]|uniref:glutathione binding-like protein n=1 Tax=Ancylobacter lacus TaxID=2579970 RepID=UPI001FEB34C7|nr:glutathione binding-like protein [Ancylobacter lacus]
MFDAYAFATPNSIADIAHFDWLWRRESVGVALDDTPHVGRWYAEVESRPAVQRAIARVNALIPAA